MALVRTLKWVQALARIVKVMNDARILSLDYDGVFHTDATYHWSE